MQTQIAVNLTYVKQKQLRQVKIIVERMHINIILATFNFYKIDNDHIVKRFVNMYLFKQILVASIRSQIIQRPYMDCIALA